MTLTSRIAAAPSPAQRGKAGMGARLFNAAPLALPLPPTPTPTLPRPAGEGAHP
jgi:hypothetical protein